MIKNMWYAVLESCEVGEKPFYTKRLNKNLCLWRGENGVINCIEDKCCHRGASLSHGFIHEGNVCCPFHGFQYNKEGSVVNIPANGDKEKINDKIGFPENLKDKYFSYSTLQEIWKCHYTRCIENQLDVVHVPFVHKKTIGRHANKEVKDLHVETEGKLIMFYTGEYKKTYLEFYFPNTWQNIIIDKMRVFAVFAPIDETNTMIYIRYYQKFVNIPILKNIINFFGIKFSKKVLHEDKRVVETEPPYETHLNMGEELIEGDKPIVEYRRMRQNFEK